MKSQHNLRNTPCRTRNSSVVAAVLVCVCLFGLRHSRAQTAVPPSEFEVASIKLNPNCGGGSPRGNVVPGRISLPCISLRSLIRTAYSGFAGQTLNSRLLKVVGGPAWLDTDRYDISATADDAAPVALMMGPMLQRLLKERFQVQTHQEFRESPVYELRVMGTSKPLKLQHSKDGSCTPMEPQNLRSPVVEPGQPLPKICGTGRTRGDANHMVTDWYGVTMAELAGRMLPNYVDRPVIDKTGLAERFDIHLEFVRDTSKSAAIHLNGAVGPDLKMPSDDGFGLSIFAALQDQGLKLSPATGPVEVIVVDHAEKPTAN